MLVAPYRNLTGSTCIAVAKLKEDASALDALYGATKHAKWAGGKACPFFVQRAQAAVASLSCHVAVQGAVL